MMSASTTPHVLLLMALSHLVKYHHSVSCRPASWPSIYCTMSSAADGGNTWCR